MTKTSKTPKTTKSICSDKKWQEESSKRNARFAAIGQKPKGRM